MIHLLCLLFFSLSQRNKNKSSCSICKPSSTLCRLLRNMRHTKWVSERVMQLPVCLLPGQTPSPSGHSPRCFVLSYFLCCLCESMGGSVAMLLTQKCLHTRIFLSVCKLLIVWVVLVLSGWGVGRALACLLACSNLARLEFPYSYLMILFFSFVLSILLVVSSSSLIDSVDTTTASDFPPNSNFACFCSASDKELSGFSEAVSKTCSPPHGSNPNLCVRHRKPIID